VFCQKNCRLSVLLSFALQKFRFFRDAKPTRTGELNSLSAPLYVHFSPMPTPCIDALHVFDFITIIPIIISFLFR